MQESPDLGRTGFAARRLGVFGVFITGKAIAVAALLGGILLFFWPLHQWNYLVFSDKDAGIWLAFINWDGQHYLRLALNGYPVPPNPSSAFYPLFPALIAGVMKLGIGPIAAGITVVTLFSALALELLHRLLPDNEPRPSSLWLLASFPTAFYLSVVYAESVFLAAFLGLAWSLRDRRRVGWALLCAAALPLTRGQGLWMIVPIAVAWIVQRRRASGSEPFDGATLTAASLGYALGVVAYLGFYWWQYGDPLLGFAAQEAFVFNNSISNLLNVPRLIDFLFSPPNRFLDTNNSGLDKAAIVVSLLALVFGARRCRDPFVLASWICFAVLPVLMGEGGSYARHALLAWACFALSVGPTLSAPFKRTLSLSGFAVQIFLAFYFGANRWVG